MALADPQSLTIGGTATSFPRTDGPNPGVFTSVDGTSSFKVTPLNGKRHRRTVRLDFSKIAADPLTAVNKRVSGSVYVVVDFPVDGFTTTDLVNQVKALSDWLTASTNANTIKVLVGES
jgi:hypothetical protein